MDILLEFRNYIITLTVFLLIDMVWLIFIAKKIYSKYLGYLMAEKPNLIAALIFYIIFIVGVLFFVINPALELNNIMYVIFPALLFGLVTYATYDLTNLATIKDWPIKITIIDLIWGSSVTALTSVISYTIITML